jgi:hypothetical protein
MFLGLVCLAGGLVGSILQEDVKALQLMYFGAMLFIILSTCAFDSLSAACIKHSQPDEVIEVFTPVSAATRLGKSKELVNFLAVSSRTCFRCRRLTAVGEPGVMKVQLIWNDLVQRVLLCRECLDAYREGTSHAHSEPICAVCLVVEVLVVCYHGVIDFQKQRKFSVRKRRAALVKTDICFISFVSSSGWNKVKEGLVQFAEE